MHTIANQAERPNYSSLIIAKYKKDWSWLTVAKTKPWTVVLHPCTWETIRVSGLLDEIQITSPGDGSPVTSLSKPQPAAAILQYIADGSAISYFQENKYISTKQKQNLIFYLHGQRPIYIHAGIVNIMGPSLNQTRRHTGPDPKYQRKK
jgi:hypothetical protein